MNNNYWYLSSNKVIRTEIHQEEWKRTHQVKDSLNYLSFLEDKQMNGCEFSREEEDYSKSLYYYYVYGISELGTCVHSF